MSPRGGVDPKLTPTPPNSGFERVAYSDPPPSPDPNRPSLLYEIDVFQNASPAARFGVTEIEYW